jgi:hypothetical protein
MIPLISFVFFVKIRLAGNGGRPGGRMNMAANFLADLIQAGSVKIIKPYQPPKWMGQPLADLHGRSANDQPFVGIATKNAPGIGWSYYRYPHIASSAWLGLALLQKPSEDSPVRSLGIW